MSFKIPQPNTEITEGRGLVTRPWYKFLRDLLGAADDTDRICLSTLTDSNTTTGQLIFAKSSAWSSWTENTNYEFLSKTKGIVYTSTDGKFTVPSNGDYHVCANLLVLAEESNQLNEFALTVNGTVEYNQDVYISGASEEQILTMSILKTFSAGDALQFSVRQATYATNKNISILANSSISIWRVAG